MLLFFSSPTTLMQAAIVSHLDQVMTSALFCPCFLSCSPSVHYSQSSQKRFKMNLCPCLSPSSNSSIVPPCPHIHVKRKLLTRPSSCDPCLPLNLVRPRPHCLSAHQFTFASRTLSALPSAWNTVPAALPFSSSRLMALPSQCSVLLCFFQEDCHDSPSTARLNWCPISALS